MTAMPSHRILLLLRRPAEIRLTELGRTVARLRRCAGVADVVLGLRDPRGIRLLSPWLFLPAQALPEGMSAPLPLDHLGGPGDDRPEGGLATMIAHALVAQPLSIRDPKSLRGSFSRIVLANPAQWTAAEREALAAELPMLDLPATVAAPGAFKSGGRIREPGVGGPLRILALNLVEPAGQALLGRFIYELGRQRRLVELLDHREPTQAAPMFQDGLLVRTLDPDTDQSAEPWHLVLMGQDLPFRARQFARLTARLFLFSRPTILFREHRPVLAALDAARLTFELTEQRGSRWHALTDTTSDWSMTTLHNAQIFAGGSEAPKPPLAAYLALAQALEGGRSPISALASAERFRERFGTPAMPDDVTAARLLAHRGYDPFQDPWILLSLAGDVARLLTVEEQGPFRHAVFMRFLRRPPDSDSDPEGRPSLRKRIDIVRGVIRSAEYGRAAPPAAVEATRSLVGLLHDAIFSGRPLGEAAQGTATEASAIMQACFALVAHRIGEPDHATAR